MKMTGRGILNIGGTEFVVLSAEEAVGIYLPSTDKPTYFVAPKFEVSHTEVFFGVPSWLTVIGNAYIRWFPKVKLVEVQDSE